LHRGYEKHRELERDILRERGESKRDSKRFSCSSCCMLSVKGNREGRREEAASLFLPFLTETRNREGELRERTWVNFCRKYRGEGESIPLVLSCCFSAKEEEMGCLLQWTKQKNRRKESCRKQRPKLQKNKGDRESFESLEKEKCGLKGGCSPLFIRAWMVGIA
jgi:hypothetical protein